MEIAWTPWTINIAAQTHSSTRKLVSSRKEKKGKRWKTRSKREKSSSYLKIGENTNLYEKNITWKENNNNKEEEKEAFHCHPQYIWKKNLNKKEENIFFHAATQRIGIKGVF